MSRFGIDAVHNDPEDGPGWTVSLPHQCDRWRIVTAADRETTLRELAFLMGELEYTHNAIAAGKQLRYGEWDPVAQNYPRQITPAAGATDA